MRRLALAVFWVASVSWGQDKKVGPAAPPPTPEENRANLLLATGLGDKNPDTRKQAVASLGLIGPREPYITEINNAISDKDMYVRLAAVASLVDLKDKGTADMLDKALHDVAPEVSFAAAKALFGLDDERGRTRSHGDSGARGQDAIRVPDGGEARHFAAGAYSQGHDDLRDQERHRFRASAGAGRGCFFDAGDHVRQRGLGTRHHGGAAGERP